MLGRTTKWTVAGLALFLGACGGSSNGTQPASHLAAGSYQLSLCMDTSSASDPVDGIDLTIQLPEGAEVATASDGTGTIVKTDLTTGSALTGTSLMVGQYIASSHRVHLSLTTTAATAWSGEFARLKIAIPPGTTVTESTLLETAGGSFPTYKVVGLRAPTRSTVSLSDQTKTTLSLVK